ncbi:MAG TPA: 16S rRNA (guanine(527)-N(7))-methyltransferase RsmG [bacterium]|nr:16S rRNA (guanine(527)-N(7))-methyltransferase RsmG [bacterium]
MPSRRHPRGSEITVPAAAADLGLSLSAHQQSRLDRYLALVDEWRGRVQLTGADAAATPAVLAVGALCVIPFVPAAGALLDLGSGAGVPGIPIAVMRPGLRVVLADSARRKVAFLGIVVRELGLANVDVAQARAEDLGRDASHREQYAVVTARALAPVRVLAEYAFPLLRIGGEAVLPKGRGARDEVRAAARALDLLGGEAAVHDPCTPFCSPVVVLRKTSSTPPAYPRRAGTPQRHPL